MLQHLDTISKIGCHGDPIEHTMGTMESVGIRQTVYWLAVVKSEIDHF